MILVDGQPLTRWRFAQHEVHEGTKNTKGFFSTQKNILLFVAFVSSCLRAARSATVIRSQA